MKALHADMLNSIQCLDRHLIGKIAVADNRLGCSHRFHGFQYGESLRTVSAAVKMKAENKAGFAVQNEPEVVFLTPYLNNSFIGVPLVRVEIKRRNELQSDVLEHGSEAGAPVADSCVRYLDIHHGAQNQSDIAEGILAQIEHTQDHENYMNRITHPLKIRLSKEFGHGWGGNGSRLWCEDRMTAFFVAAGIIVIMFATMVQIHGFAANWAGRGIGIPLLGWSIRCPLVPALLALIFLMPMFIFSIAIKVCFVVAFRAAYLV